MLARRLALLLVASCGSDGGGGEPPRDSHDSWPGTVTWSWTFSDGGGCPAEVTKANIYIASYDRTAFNVRNEPRIMTSVSCASGAGSFPLGTPAGIGNQGHDTWLELATADGRVFARSAIVNTRTKNANPSAVIEVPRGWVHAQWTLFGQQSGRTLACDEVPPLSSASSADGAVMIYETVANDVVLQPTAIACARGEMWLGLVPGTYELSLGAFSGLDFILGEIMNPKLLGKSTLGMQTVTAGATVELGTLTLNLPAY